jgi:hypothetical protein
MASPQAVATIPMTIDFSDHAEEHTRCIRIRMIRALADRRHLDANMGPTR